MCHEVSRQTNYGSFSFCNLCSSVAFPFLIPGYALHKLCTAEVAAGYLGQFCIPWHRRDMDLLEQVQCKATKMIKGLGVSFT